MSVKSHYTKVGVETATSLEFSTS